ncbi:MAG: NADP-dependent oxidoreductase [Sandaracinaceae bacterium]|nr:NADP-dependent oxidoreductase [Sandaracinaceae bacterium]
MRAVRIHEYGGPEVLRIEDVPEPSPGPNDVLVRVCATSVNPVDCKIRSGGQRAVIFYRLPWILGLDVSGVVEAVGERVTRFRPGDEVWSSPTHRRPGAYAEKLCIDEREVALKPKRLTHDEAASMPLVGLTAYQCIVEKGRLEKGQRVLIHAGAGGVGSFAIQLAHHIGARVITTCSARNEALVRELGADEVIDYTKERIEDAVSEVDLVLDSVGEDAMKANVAVTRRGGRISNITLDLPRYVARYGPALGFVVIGARVAWMHVAPFLEKEIVLRHVLKRCDGEQLAELARLVDGGAIRPTIDQVLPLDAIQEAHRHSETHRARGKIVLHVADG